MKGTKDRVRELGSFVADAAHRARVNRGPFIEDELLRISNRARVLADHEHDGLLKDALRHLAHASAAVRRNTERIRRSNSK